MIQCKVSNYKKYPYRTNPHILKSIRRIDEYYKSFLICAKKPITTYSLRITGILAKLEICILTLGNFRAFIQFKNEHVK